MNLFIYSPNFSSTLCREALLTQLSTKLVDKEREIDNRMSTYSEQGRFLTEIAAKVVWIRQQSNKVALLFKNSLLHRKKLVQPSPFFS